MTYDALPALTAFAFVSSITPGPNNLMLMVSGANFGFSRSAPHMLGVGIGLTVMIVLVGAGLIQVFDTWPVSHAILKTASVIYLLWLAWKIANASAPKDANAAARPLSFVQAALFQWVNPKTWTMALTAISIFAPDRSITAIFWVALVFGLINLPSVSTWTLLGGQMWRILSSPTRLRLFNVSMALLLVASLYPVVTGG